MSELRDVFTSENVCGSNGEVANLVDTTDDIARALSRLANAIKPSSTSPGHDEAGGTVDSLTEAVMGVTTGLCKIAASISDLADAVRSRGA